MELFAKLFNDWKLVVIFAKQVYHRCFKVSQIFQTWVPKKTITSIMNVNPLNIYPKQLKWYHFETNFVMLAFIPHRK